MQEQLFLAPLDGRHMRPSWPERYLRHGVHAVWELQRYEQNVIVSDRDAADRVHEPLAEVAYPGFGMPSRARCLHSPLAPDLRHLGSKRRQGRRSRRRTWIGGVIGRIDCPA